MSSSLHSRLVLELSDFLEAAHRAATLPNPLNGPAASGQNFIDTIGHFLRFGPSTNPEAGDGAFLYEGQVGKGKIVTLFPGLVYPLGTQLDKAEHEGSGLLRAGNDAIAQSYVKQDVGENPYQLIGDCSGRRYLVDGRPNGVSSGEFVGVAQEAAGMGWSVNCSWLDEPGLEIPRADPTSGSAASLFASPNKRGAASLQSFMAQAAFKETLIQCSLGHKVNASADGFAANVRSSIVEIPQEFPLDLLQYVPSLLVEQQIDQGSEGMLRLNSSTRLAVVIQAATDLDTRVDGPFELFID